MSISPYLTSQSCCFRNLKLLLAEAGRLAGAIKQRILLNNIAQIDMVRMPGKTTKDEVRRAACKASPIQHDTATSLLAHDRLEILECSIMSPDWSGSGIHGHQIDHNRRGLRFAGWTGNTVHSYEQDALTQDSQHVQSSTDLRSINLSFFHFYYITFHYQIMNLLRFHYQSFQLKLQSVMPKELLDQDLGGQVLAVRQELAQMPSPWICVETVPLRFDH